MKNDKRYYSKEKLRFKNLVKTGNFFYNSFGFSFFEKTIIVDFEEFKNVASKVNEILNETLIDFNKIESGKRQDVVFTLGWLGMGFEIIPVYDEQGKNMKIRIIKGSYSSN